MALLTMTILSTALAAAASVTAWRLVRLETRRSDARVAALAAAIYGPAGPASAETSTAIATFPSEYPAVAAEDRRASILTGRRSLAMASAAIAVVVAGLLILAASRPGHALEENRAAVSSAAATASSQPSAGTTAAAPLELIALGHERGKDVLVVRGEIRNPSNGVPCDMPAVVVLTFDEHGIFLGSTESDASGEQLPPGGRAAFSVSIPARTTPARYKISFRSEGQIVPHVDRRVPEAGSDNIDNVSKPPRRAAAGLPVHS
jgi:hypothetical protein